MPIDNDLLYRTRAIANYLELPVQKFRDLINLADIPTFTMPGSTNALRPEVIPERHLAEIRTGGSTARLGGVIWMQNTPIATGRKRQGYAGQGGGYLRGMAAPARKPNQTVVPGSQQAKSDGEKKLPPSRKRSGVGWL
jgi:hypothetical protein